MLIEEIYAYMTQPLRLERGTKANSKLTFQRSPTGMVVDVVLTSNICNLGGGILDISIDLCRIDIALNQGVLSIVEKVHSQQ